MDFKEPTTLICQDFELDLPFGEQAYSKEEVRKWLANVIARLMHEDMERLLWILYRLDISEKKAIEALSLSAAPDLALADLVIERKLQKIQTRKQYKEWQAKQSNDVHMNDVEAW